MKEYSEQRYPVAIAVKVSYPDQSWIDDIKGLNVGHALHLAQLNWPDASIEHVSWARFDAADHLGNE